MRGRMNRLRMLVMIAVSGCRTKPVVEPEAVPAQPAVDVAEPTPPASAGEITVDASTTLSMRVPEPAPRWAGAGENEIAYDLTGLHAVLSASSKEVPSCQAALDRYAAIVADDMQKRAVGVTAMKGIEIERPAIAGSAALHITFLMADDAAGPWKAVTAVQRCIGDTLVDLRLAARGDGEAVLDVLRPAIVKIAESVTPKVR